MSALRNTDYRGKVKSTYFRAPNKSAGLYGNSLRRAALRLRHIKLINVYISAATKTAH